MADTNTALITNSNTTDITSIEHFQYTAAIDFLGVKIPDDLKPHIFIVEMSVLNDYFENFFPLLRLKVRLPIQVYNLLLENSDTIQVQLILKKGKFFPQTSVTASTTTFGEIFNKKFINFTTLEAHDLMHKKVDQKKIDEINYTIDLYLAAVDHVKTYKKVLNKVFNNSTVLKAALYLQHRVHQSSVFL